MPTIDEILEQLKASAQELNEFGVLRLGVFGSFVTGNASEDSDIDIVVELRRKSFDTYMDLKFFLEDMFGRKVDLILADAIKPRLRERIEKEVIYASGF